MFEDDKIQRAIDAQAKVNTLLLEQHNSLSALVRDVQKRLVTAETEHLGFKYASAQDWSRANAPGQNNVLRRTLWGIPLLTVLRNPARLSEQRKMRMR